jgi:DNA-binding transcriptional LysR family regulator
MHEEIELRHLRYFVAVAEELHFGRAAERLHLSQPPLSQQIRRLEDILGYPLLERTSRSVKLTQAGESYLERARRTLRNVQRDMEEARAIAQGEVGSLHVGFVGSAMLTTLPSIFRAYCERYPRVHLHLHESFTARVTEGLYNGTLDAGILRDGERDADGHEERDGAGKARLTKAGACLHLTTLFVEPYVAVLPATHPCAGQRSISPAALRNDPFVYYPRAAGARAFEKPLTIFEEHGFRPSIVQEASHWLTILRLVAAGLGVSVAPACVKRIASPEVVCLPLEGAKVVSEVELARLAGDTRPIVDQFTQIARGT